MANTVTIAALRREAWRKELFADVIDDLYFMRNGLMGEGTNNIVQVMNDVKKDGGDTVTFGLSIKLSGDGIVGDAEAEGNEEAITTYSQSVSIDQVRNQVRMTGRLDEQKASYDMRKDAKEKLAVWIKEYTERNIFMKLGGVNTLTLTDVSGVTYSGRAAWSNSPNIVTTTDEVAGFGARYHRAGTTASGDGLDDLAAGDILTPADISLARTRAKLASPTIRPLRVEGKDYYVMFIHPNQAYDLKNASGSVWASAQREAQVRGDSNPIFTGALGIWDGVIIHEHEYVPTAVATAAFSVGGTACGVRAYRALLCGQQAACMASTNKSMFMEEETFDYKNKIGYCSGIIGGIQKSAFNSLDYGVVTVDTSSSIL
jgi:N4-gp56 family major capsid protein